MIKPITKDYFHLLADPTPKYRVVSNIELEQVNPKDEKGKAKKLLRWSNTVGMQYFEKPGQGVFAYADELNIILIPEKYQDLEVSENEDIDFSDWELELLSETPNPIYTKNCLELCKDYSDYHSCKDRYDILIDGDYRIRNSRIGFSIDVTIRINRCSYDTEILLGYPEKLEIPRRSVYTKAKDRMLKNMILWSQKD